MGIRVAGEVGKLVVATPAPAFRVEQAVELTELLIVGKYEIDWHGGQSLQALGTGQAGHFPAVDQAVRIQDGRLRKLADHAHIPGETAPPVKLAQIDFPESLKG